MILFQTNISTEAILIQFVNKSLPTASLRRIHNNVPQVRNLQPYKSVKSTDACARPCRGR